MENRSSKFQIEIKCQTYMFATISSTKNTWINVGERGILFGYVGVY